MFDWLVGCAAIIECIAALMTLALVLADRFNRPSR
jgi:hypothetical protein